MKWVFLLCFGGLLAATAAMVASRPGADAPIPVIYWGTDGNPARRAQADLFHRWQLEAGHFDTVELKTPEDVARFARQNWSPGLRAAIAGTGAEAMAALDGSLAVFPAHIRVPKVELRVDVGGNVTAKLQLQGLAGVAPDIVEMGRGATMRSFERMGLLADVTEPGLALGFDPLRTYPATRSELVVGSRQFQFPCNVTVYMMWVNRGTFEKLGLKPPPGRMTFEEFEREGRAFVEKANAGRQARTAFFANKVNVDCLRRSVGVGAFNETLTRCTLDDDRYAQVLARWRQWTYEDRLLPTAAEALQLTTVGGTGAAAVQIFNVGGFGMIWSGRWEAIYFRDYARSTGAIDLDVVEGPHGGFPNTDLGARCAGVYAGSKHKDLATLFLAYLASDLYNRQIVNDADAQPPLPASVEGEDYLRPARWPNEWKAHAAFARGARELAIPGSYSPYVLPLLASKIDNEEQEKFISALPQRIAAMPDSQRPAAVARVLAEARAAAARSAARVNAEIERTLRENPELRPQYEAAVARQGRIDALRSAGKRVPAEWVEDPYRLRYGLANGWIQP